MAKLIKLQKSKHVRENGRTKNAAKDRQTGIANSNNAPLIIRKKTR
jgi:hypothetical protein